VADVNGFLPVMRKLSLCTYISASQLSRLLAMLPSQADDGGPDMTKCGTFSSPHCCCTLQHLLIAWWAGGWVCISKRVRKA
jgi:hypothetical protein